MTTLEKMSDLRTRSAPTIRDMAAFSAEMLRLSLEQIQEKLQASFPRNLPRSRMLVLTLDACDSPATNDRKIEALQTQWPGLVVSEIVFDRNTNKFFLYTE